MDHFETANLFTDYLKETFGDKLVSVVLFGSVGRKEHQEDSDIDLIVVLKDLPAGRYVRRFVLDPVFQKTDQKGISVPINCHLKTPREAEKITVMYFDLPDGAKILFDSNHFFEKIINKVKGIIQKTGAQKKDGESFFIGT